MTAAPGNNGKAEAREQIARVLRGQLLLPTAGPTRWSLQMADAVLAVPAVAEALAAVERVRALAEEFSMLGAVLHDVPRAETFREVATDLRRALDGDRG